MAKPPELWVFVLANASLFIVSSVITALCYLAYRQSGGQRSYKIATLGFGCIVFGGLVAPVVQLWHSIDYTLNGDQILLIESAETTFLAVGLGLLFYAITQHDSGTASKKEDYAALAYEDIDEMSDQQSAD